MSNLQSSSVLVKLTIKMWDGFRKDKRVAQHVDSQFHTSGGAGNYNKRLLDKSVINPVTKIAGKLRKEHARLTVPWCYDGVSLLPNDLYFHYTESVRNYKGQFDVAVANLVSQYPIYKANQAKKLGALYDPTEYPSADEISRRFSIDTSFFPVPSSDHFLADLGDQGKLKESLKAELQNVQSSAVRELYSRIHEMLTHMHERLSDPENVFRDSLVGNLEQIVEVLPALNVFKDPTLDIVHKKLRDELLVADPADLRTDLVMRRAVADTAYDIANLLNGGESGNSN